MQFFLHVEEPPFQCIQGVRIVGARGGHYCCVTFLEGADKIWIKYWQLPVNKFCSLLITSYEFVYRFDKSDLIIHKFNSVSSIMPYHDLLREEFVIMHHRKSRNLNDFPFCAVKYLWRYKITLVRLEAAWYEIIGDIHIRTNFVGGQPSSSYLCISFCFKISCTSDRFRTKITYDRPCRERCGRNYRHRMTADCSSILQLKKAEGLGEQVERDSDELLQFPWLSTVVELTSRMTAQGLGTASKVAPVTEHVIGLASYRVWYAAGYASSNSFLVPVSCALSSPSKQMDGERIL